MKAYVLVSTSHRGMFEDYLLSTVPRDIELVVQEADQNCSSGSYMSNGWITCMREKVEMMVRAIEENEGECILHIDADIQFFVPRIGGLIRRRIRGLDLVAQDDTRLGGGGDPLCGGLFAVRAGDATRRLF